MAGTIALADPVTQLPLFDGRLPFESDAGYIDVDEAPHTKHMFYWMVKDQDGPWEDSDTVLWLTGGPGCSSLLAFMTEHGPLHFGPDGNSLVVNPYSWGLDAANIIYLEAPVGVGFSYADDGNYTTGDDETARVNLGFLEGFFKKFPQLRKNRLFISGESYAGHYVPQLAAAVVEANKKGANLNLRGWLVGNPSWDHTDGSHYFDFMQLHSIIDRADYRAALKTCNGTLGLGASPACDKAVAALRQQTIGINPYDVIGKCIGKPSLNGGCLTQQLEDLAAGASAMPRRGIAQTFVPCINVTASTSYFGRPDVREALHVASGSLPWDVCSQVVQYRQFAPTVAPIYEALAPSHTVLVYSGDVDSCVPFPGTQDSVDALGFPVKTAWTPWHVSGQIAGFERKYDVGSGGSLAWRSVRGASHMVPNSKPAAAATLFGEFLASAPP